jgi:hypothetical protein
MEVSIVWTAVHVWHRVSASDYFSCNSNGIRQPGDRSIARLFLKNI